MSSRILNNSLEMPGAPRASAPAATRPAPAPAGSWRYPAPARTSRLYWAGLALSCTSHVVILFAFNGPMKPVRTAAPDGQILEVRLALPDIPLEPEEQLPEEMPDISNEALPVPTLVEVPTVVPVDAFVQAADFRPQMDVNFDAAQLVSIPTIIGRGAGAGNGLSNIFNISDLDRVPEVISQTPPVFPFEQKRLGIERAEVIVAFVVDAEGRVSQVTVEQSTHREFEHAAITAVSKWKFRPGQKGGRKVATRMRVPLRFHLLDELA